MYSYAREPYPPKVTFRTSEIAVINRAIDNRGAGGLIEIYGCFGMLVSMEGVLGSRDVTITLYVATPAEIAAHKARVREERATKCAVLKGKIKAAQERLSALHAELEAVAA